MQANYPVPAGYRILVKLDKPKDKIGNVFIPAKSQDDEKHLSMMGDVVAVGADAYRDEKFSSPWCKLGDTIMFSKYAGTRFMVGDDELRLLNDDEVQAIVPDRDAVKRVPTGLV